MTPWMTQPFLWEAVGHYSLQFGHGGDAVDDLETPARPRPLPQCFNSATAVTPWMTARTLPRIQILEWLQFGHGGDAVDDVARRRRLRVLAQASIRPRR